jgi:hypothetical protein
MVERPQARLRNVATGGIQSEALGGATSQEVQHDCLNLRRDPLDRLRSIHDMTV